MTEVAGGGGIRSQRWERWREGNEGERRARTARAMGQSQKVWEEAMVWGGAGAQQGHRHGRTREPGEALQARRQRGSLRRLGMGRRQATARAEAKAREAAWRAAWGEGKGDEAVVEAVECVGVFQPDTSSFSPDAWTFTGLYRSQALS